MCEDDNLNSGNEEKGGKNGGKSKRKGTKTKNANKDDGN